MDVNELKKSEREIEFYHFTIEEIALKFLNELKDICKYNLDGMYNRLISLSNSSKICPKIGKHEIEEVKSKLLAGINQESVQFQNLLKDHLSIQNNVLCYGDELLTRRSSSNQKEIISKLKEEVIRLQIMIGKCKQELETHEMERSLLQEMKKSIHVENSVCNSDYEEIWKDVKDLIKKS